MHKKMKAAPLIYELTILRLVVLVSSLIIVGCSGSTNLASTLADTPEYKPEDQVKTKAAKSSNSPLIVEWPVSEKATLEALAQRGVVAVRYEMGEMEVLKSCRVKNDAYDWVAVTPKDEAVRISNMDELHAQLPVGAISLEGKLRKAGELNVTFTVAGRWQSTKVSFSHSDLEGDCRGATHVITAMTAGAYEFFAGSDAEIKAGASAGVGEVGGSSAAKKEIIRSDGEPEACQRSTSEDMSPPQNCGALIRIDVVRLKRDEKGEKDWTRTGVHMRIWCGDNYDYLGPKDGLKVYCDDELVNASDERVQMNKVEWVEYPMEPGRHRLRVEADTCLPEEITVDIEEGDLAEIQGHLDRELRSVIALFEGPANLVGHNLQFQLAYTTSILPSSFKFTRDKDGDDPPGKTPLAFSTKGTVGGFTFSGGNAGHWYTWLFDLGISRSRELDINKTDLKINGEVPAVTIGQFRFRGGFRLGLPFSSFSVGAGFSGSAWRVDVNDGGDPGRTYSLGIPLWSELAVKPLCDWGLGFWAAYNLAWQPAEQIEADYWILAAHVTYQSNRRCRKKTVGLRNMER